MEYIILNPIKSNKNPNEILENEITKGNNKFIINVLSSNKVDFFRFRFELGFLFEFKFPYKFIRFKTK